MDNYDDIDPRWRKDAVERLRQHFAGGMVKPPITIETNHPDLGFTSVIATAKMLDEAGWFSDCIDGKAIRTDIIRDEDRDYFTALLKLPSHVVPIQTMADAQAGRCHCNARRWVEAHSGFEVAPGWLHYVDGQPYFIAHTVVGDSNRNLIDVSPFEGQALDERMKLKFIVHPGTSAEYRILRDTYDGGRVHFHRG